MGANPPNIFHYADYRSYLGDLFEYKKATTKGRYGLRKFCLFCGFHSDGGIRHLLTGRRNLTKPKLAQVANALPFSRGEKEFFMDLVRWNQAKTVQDTVAYFDRLSKHLMRVYIMELSGGQAELLLARWYYSVVREMAVLQNFRSDPEWISQELGGMITPDEAKEAMALLLDNKFLQKNGEHYVATDKHIHLETGIAQRMLDLLHVQSISASLRAIKDLQPCDREIHSITMSLSPEGFEKLRQYLRDALCSIATEAGREVAPKHVCQCNLQFLRLTRGGE